MATKKPKAEAPIQRRPMVGAKTQVARGVEYFASKDQKTGLTFFSSGCVLLDAALGGGWALGRVVNVVGDKSAGKTLLAMEAIANFAMTFPNGRIRYAESEAAFDREYAGALGIPLDRVIFNDDVKQGGRIIETVEDLNADLQEFSDACKKDGVPGLHIIDSLDAISDEAEQKRDFDEGSYGGTKPKQIGKMFRMQVQELEERNISFFVISQLRDKIGVTFGETKTRSGGKALDFYASHIVWLAEISKLKKTREKLDRVIGIQVKAKIKKNKVGLPFREAEYPILFGYGIDDLTSSVEWLIEVGREGLLADLGLSKAGYKLRLANLREKGGQEVAELRQELSALIHSEWAKIETGFMPTSRKYG